jgi:hypothetical protein
MDAKSIREAFDQLGWTATNKAVKEHLMDSDINVTSQQISNERAKHHDSSFDPEELLELSEFLKDETVIRFVKYMAQLKQRRHE